MIDLLLCEVIDDIEEIEIETVDFDFDFVDGRLRLDMRLSFSISRNRLLAREADDTKSWGEISLLDDELNDEIWLWEFRKLLR